MILQKRRETYRRWVESQDIEVVRAKQREKSRKYYQKQRMLKELQKQQEETNVEQVEETRQIQESESVSSVNDSETLSIQSTNIENSENGTTSSETTCDENDCNENDALSPHQEEMFDTAIKALMEIDNEIVKHTHGSREFDEWLLKSEYVVKKVRRCLGKIYPYIVIQKAMRQLGRELSVSPHSHKLYLEGADATGIQKMLTYNENEDKEACNVYFNVSSLIREEMVEIVISELIKLDNEAVKHSDKSREFEKCLLKAYYFLRRVRYCLGKTYPFIVIDRTVNRLGYKIRLSRDSYDLYRRTRNFTSIEYILQR